MRKQNPFWLLYDCGYICSSILLFLTFGLSYAQVNEPDRSVNIGVMMEMSGPTASNGKFCSEVQEYR